jgi:hypothetical protein
VAFVVDGFLGKGLNEVDLMESFDLDLGDFDDEDEFGNTGVDG